MSMDPSLYTMLERPLTSISQFFSGPVSRTFSNLDHQDHVVMDMGCGPGNFSTQLILGLLPNVKKVCAVDVQRSMIEHAREHHRHPKVEYSVGDISIWSSVEKWEGQISSFFSIHVVQWIKDQRQSFENTLRLLKAGGRAVFFFVLQSTFYEACLEIAKDDRWSEFLKNVDTHVPPSHVDKYDPGYYTSILEDMGFNIEHCKSEVKVDSFSSDREYRDFFISICVLMDYIPDEMKEQFKKDVIGILTRINGKVEGLPVHRGRMLELIVRKPEEKI